MTMRTVKKSRYCASCVKKWRYRIMGEIESQREWSEDDAKFGQICWGFEEEGLIWKRNPWVAIDLWIEVRDIRAIGILKMSGNSEITISAALLQIRKLHESDLIGVNGEGKVQSQVSRSWLLKREAIVRDSAAFPWVVSCQNQGIAQNFRRNRTWRVILLLSSSRGYGSLCHCPQTSSIVSTLCGSVISLSVSNRRRSNSPNHVFRSCTVDWLSHPRRNRCIPHRGKVFASRYGCDSPAQEFAHRICFSMIWLSLYACYSWVPEISWGSSFPISENLQSCGPEIVGVSRSEKGKLDTTKPNERSQRDERLRGKSRFLRESRKRKKRGKEKQRYSNVGNEINIWICTIGVKNAGHIRATEGAIAV
jgi:hypothetical protein